MSTYDCITCGKSVLVSKNIHHSPQCIFDTSRAEGYLSFCTCNKCKGRRTHPGDNADGTYLEEVLGNRSVVPNLPPSDPVTTSPVNNNNKRESVSAASESPTSKHLRTEEGTATTMVTLSKKRLDEPEHTQLVGTHCFICKQAKTPSATPYPFLFMGKYRELMLCTKKHLQKTFQDTEAAFNKEFQFMNANNDTEPGMLNFNARSYFELGMFSTNSQEEETSLSLNDEYCGGLGNNDVPCNARCSKSLFTCQDTTIIYFCKPSHFLRHTLKKYGKGQRAKNTHKKELTAKGFIA
jgi:hypothetical protein